MEPRPLEELRHDPAHLLLLLVAAISVALLVLVFPLTSRQDPWDAVNVTVVAVAVLLGLLSSRGKSLAIDEDDSASDCGKKKRLGDDCRVINVPKDYSELASTSRSRPPLEFQANLAVTPSLQQITVNVVGERVKPTNKAGTKQSPMPIPAAYDEQQRSYREKKALDHQHEQYYKDDFVIFKSANKAGSKRSVLSADVNEKQQRSHPEKKLANRRDGLYYKDDLVTLESGIKAGLERSVLPANATNEQQRLHREKKVANHRDEQYFKDGSIRLESVIRKRCIACLIFLHRLDGAL